MGVHTALATAKKRKWRILNPRPHSVEKKFFSKYDHAVYHWKVFEELNNFYERTIG